MACVPLTKLGELAVTLAISAPFTVGSWPIVRLKFARVWPARIVTDAGTTNSLRLSDVKVTTRLVGSVPEMRTVPALVRTPSFSRAYGGNETIRLVLSLSWTLRRAEP